MTPETDKPTVIVPFGQFPHPGGMQLIDGEAVERIMAQFSRWDRDIVVDYQHASMKECLRAPAAGWLKVNTAVVTEKGIEAVIEWLSEARELIESKQFLYLSPVFEKTNGRITGLLNLGLTNNPNIHAMAPLVNQLTNQERRMENNLDAVLKERLKLDPAADDEKIVEAVEILMNENESAQSLASLLGDTVALLGLTPEDTDESIIARITELATEAGQRRNGEIETVVNEAISAGKLRPNLRSWAASLARSNPGSFKTFLVNSGPAAPLGGVITAGASPRPRLSVSEANVCRMLGLDEKEYINFGELPS